MLPSTFQHLARLLVQTLRSLILAAVADAAHRQLVIASLDCLEHALSHTREHHLAPLPQTNPTSE